MTDDMNASQVNAAGSTAPMEPMDTYLCVLLKLQLIQSPGTYTQQWICGTIASNKTEFDAVYGNPTLCNLARIEYMQATRFIDVIDKESDCGRGALQQ